MNKEQLQQDIEAIKSKLASMEQQLKDCDKPKMFPQVGEVIYAFDSYGDILIGYAKDKKYVNVYRTEKEAEKARDIAFAKQRLKYAIEVANEGWTPDWKDDNYKYCFTLYSGTIYIDHFLGYKHQPTYMYMKSKQIAEHILKEHEADIKLIFSE